MTSKESTVSTNQQTEKRAPVADVPPAFSAELRQLLEKAGRTRFGCTYAGIDDSGPLPLRVRHLCHEEEFPKYEIL
jgi:hypothetical protein